MQALCGLRSAWPKKLQIIFVKKKKYQQVIQNFKYNLNLQALDKIRGGLYNFFAVFENYYIFFLLN
jgi:hypothetical protein